LELQDEQLRHAIIAEGMQACNEGIFPDNSANSRDAEITDVLDKFNEFEHIVNGP